MLEDDYKVKLDIFEGPMDLLVYLIRKAKVDIYDIPIALVTDQFLAYLDWMKSMNIDFAGDFLLMAATLTHIKSRMLLPIHDDEDEDEDPRMEIVRPLAEYLQIKLAAEELMDRSLLGEDTFSRSAVKEEIPADQDEEMINVGLFELIDAFQTILNNISPEHKVDMRADRISVKDRMNEIIDMLEQKGSVVFDELFSGNETKSNIIVTFLAILEMAKLNLIRIVQHLQSGILRLFYL
ncbi:MAG: chromosome segregation protein ScpA [Desulfobacteraceae bacterium]|nr:MAG: chromosome segregation protein ScpA [Desulfobacteraceae bacterium]